MPENFPPWQDVRKKLLEAGVTEAQIDMDLKEMEQRSSSATLDVKYYLIARVKHKIDVPKITTLGRSGASGPAVRILCKDVTLKMAREATEDGTKFELSGFVYRALEGKTRNGKPQFTVTLLDHTGSLDIIAYGDGVDKLSALKMEDGAFLHIDQLQVEYREFEKRDKTMGSAFTCKMLPWAEPVVVQPPEGYGLESCFKDAVTHMVGDNELAFVRGFVVDDDRGDKETGAKVFTVCKETGRKVDKDSQMCDFQRNPHDCIPHDLAYRRMTVSPGGKMFTVTFPPDRHPDIEDLTGQSGTFFCRFGKKYNEYSVLWFEMGTERQISSAREVLTGYTEESTSLSKPLKNPNALKSPPSPAPVVEKKVTSFIPPTKSLTALQHKKAFRESVDNINHLKSILIELASQSAKREIMWDEAVKILHERHGFGESDFEDGVNYLMDTGHVAERVLGRLQWVESLPSPIPSAPSPPEAEAETVTTEQVLEELKIPVIGFRLTEIKDALKNAGYEDIEGTLKILMDEGLVTKMAGRYFSAKNSPPGEVSAGGAGVATTPQVETPQKALPASSAVVNKGWPTSFPPAGKSVVETFLVHFRQNPRDAIIRKLKEKCQVDDNGAMNLLESLKVNGLITDDPDIARQYGINNPGGGPAKPFLYWIG